MWGMAGSILTLSQYGLFSSMTDLCLARLEHDILHKGKVINLHYLFMTHRYLPQLSGIVRFKKFSVLCLLLLFMLSGCGGNGGSDAYNISSADDPPGVTEDSISPVAAQIPADGVSAEIDDESPFAFIYNDVRIYLREYMALILAEIGEPLYVHEAPSCIFDGIARIYVFDGFEMEAIPLDGSDEDSVIVIMLTGDNVSTANGVSIGQTYKDMIAAYGTGYETFPGGSFMYERNGDVLSFNIFNGIILSISYFVDDIY